MDKNCKSPFPVAFNGFFVSRIRIQDFDFNMILGGASVDVLDSNGVTLLHSAIVDKNSKVALFLLNNGADVNLRSVNTAFSFVLRYLKLNPISRNLFMIKLKKKKD